VTLGVLGNFYAEVLLEPLLQLKAVERIEYEVALNSYIEELSKLFEKETNSLLAVEKTENLWSQQELWYPNLPGWTWQEVSPDNIPSNIDPDEDTTVLIQGDRENKRHIL